MEQTGALDGKHGSIPEDAIFGGLAICRVMVEQDSSGNSELQIYGREGGCMSYNLSRDARHPDRDLQLFCAYCKRRRTTLVRAMKKASDVSTRYGRAS